MCLPPVGGGGGWPGFKTNSRIKHRRHKGSQAGTGRHPEMRREDAAPTTSRALAYQQRIRGRVCRYTCAPNIRDRRFHHKNTRAHRGCELAAELKGVEGILERIPRLHLHFDWFVSLKLKENPSKRGQKYQINAKPPTGFDFWQTLLL